MMSGQRTSSGLAPTATCHDAGAEIDSLVPAQADALRSALSLGPPSPALPFAIAAGTVSLIAAVAERGGRPLLVVIDDLQWVDHGSRRALLFAALWATRSCLLGEPIFLCCARRSRRTARRATFSASNRS